MCDYFGFLTFIQFYNIPYDRITEGGGSKYFQLFTHPEDSCEVWLVDEGFNISAVFKSLKIKKKNKQTNYVHLIYQLGSFNNRAVKATLQTFFPPTTQFVNVERLDSSFQVICNLCDSFSILCYHPSLLV